MIDKLTIAVGDPTVSAHFYGAVFGARLRPFTMAGSTLWIGHLGSMELVICAREVAGIEARENTIQPRFVVADVEEAVRAAIQAGGTPIGEITAIGAIRMAAVRDPDGYSIELIERP